MSGFLNSNGRNNYSSMQCSKEERQAVSKQKVDKNPFNNKKGSVDDLEPEVQIAYYLKVIEGLPVFNRKDRKYYQDKIASLESSMRHPSSRWAS